MELLVPYVIDCWVDNMRLVYDNVTRTTDNAPGVDIVVPGFGNTSTVEYVDPSNISIAGTHSTSLCIIAHVLLIDFSTLLKTGYFYALVNSLSLIGYNRGADIHGAPYDFRRSPSKFTFL